MIISDLNHIEVVSEETETRIVGGFIYTFTSYNYSNSGAKGPTTSTSTFTRTITPPGSRGSSIASSSTTVSYW
jgi:hypothetical protein